MSGWWIYIVVLLPFIISFTLALPFDNLSRDKLQLSDYLFLNQVDSSDLPEDFRRKRFIPLAAHSVFRAGSLHLTAKSRKYPVKAIKLSNILRPKRSFNNAVIEGAHCEHIELIDCDNYKTNDMECMVTATGMTCCICTGQLKKEFTDYSIFR